MICFEYNCDFQFNRRLLGGRLAGAGMTTGEDRDSITKRESQKRRREKDALQMLEKAEAGGAGTKATVAAGGEKKEGEGEDEEGLDAEDQPDEFEMDDDYGVDHYASDDGGGGGDDDGDEAVY